MVNIYEYMVVGGKFVKYIHETKVDNGKYTFRKNNNRRIVYKSDLDVVKNGRVLSLEDNELMAKEMLAAHFQEQISQIERNLDIVKGNLSAVEDKMQRTTYFIDYHDGKKVIE